MLRQRIDFYAFLLTFVCIVTLLVSCDDESFFMRTGSMASLGFSVSSADDDASDRATRAVIHVMDSFELEGDTVYLVYTVTDIDAPADSAAADSAAAATRATPITGTNLSTIYGQFNVSAYVNGSLSTPLKETDDEGNPPTTGTAKEYVDIPYVYEETYGSGTSTEYLWKTTATPSNDDLGFYWPMDKTVPLSFYAYAPTSTVTSWSGLTPANNFKANGVIQFDYTVPTNQTNTITGKRVDAEGQPDILLSSIPSIKRTDSDITNVKDDSKEFCIVPLKFYHALSAVSFMVDDSDGLKRNTDFTIHSLTLSGLKASGKCTFTPSAGSKSSDVISWDFTNVTTNTGSYCQTYDQNVGSTQTADIKLGTDAQTFMLIPQTFGPGANTPAATVTIAYNEGSSKEFKLHREKKDDGTNVAWLPGKKYTYTLTKNLKDLSLTLGGALISWDKDNGTLKHRSYTLNVTNNDLTFNIPTGSQEQSFSVQSYYTDADAPTTKQQLACTVDYSLDNGSTWTEFKSSSSSSPYFSCSDLSKLTSLSGASTNLANATPISLKTDRTSHNTGTDVAKTLWTGHTPVGSASTPLDLSKTAIGGGTREGTTVNTANCYIVKEPGYYRIPLVYGNGIKGGSANTAAWKTSTTNTNVLSNFLNAAGRKVGYTFSSTSDATGTDSETPYILQNIHNTPLSAFGLTGTTSVTDGLTGSSFTCLKASLVWCDAKQNSELLVQDVQLKKVGTTIGDCAQKSYIQFKTASAANLVQGNAVIALYIDSNANSKFDAGTDPVVWSWHIWVTDADLSAAHAFTRMVNVTVGSTPVQHTFGYMRQDVGQCSGGQTRYYMTNSNLKEFKLRITQTESGLVEYVTIRQPDVFIDKAPNAPYYQTGRKDPFCPKNDDTYDLNTTGAKVLYGPDGNTIETTIDLDGTLVPRPTSTTMNAWISKTIRYPHVFWTYTVSADQYINMWNMSSTNSSGFTVTTYDHMLGTSTAKTIYDPCPYGYVTPPVTALLVGASTWEVNNAGFSTPTTTMEWYEVDPLRHVLGLRGGDNSVLTLPQYGYRQCDTGGIASLTWTRNTSNRCGSGVFHWSFTTAMKKSTIQNTSNASAAAIRPVLEE